MRVRVRVRVRVEVRGSRVGGRGSRVEGRTVRVRKGKGGRKGVMEAPGVPTRSAKKHNALLKGIGLAGWCYG